MLSLGCFVDVDGKATDNLWLGNIDQTSIPVTHEKLRGYVIPLFAGGKKGGKEPLDYTQLPSTEIFLLFQCRKNAWFDSTEKQIRGAVPSEIPSLKAVGCR